MIYQGGEEKVEGREEAAERMHVTTTLPGTSIVTINP
jgi:hypothetical protein